MSSDRATPDLTFVNLIHRALRVDGERLKVTVAALSPDDAQDRVAGVRDFYDKYKEQLIAHHTHEDELFFPALAAHVGAERMHLAELTAQHHQLDDVLRSIEEGLADLRVLDSDFPANRASVVDDLATMVDHLTTHLDLEERTALPLFASNMPRSEYVDLESRSRKVTSRAQSSFLIPWLAEHASPDQRKAWFRSAPPLWIVYRINRRSYRRLDAALVPA